MTETWLQPKTTSNEIAFQNFHLPFLKDRPEEGYGGVAIFVKPPKIDENQNTLETLVFSPEEVLDIFKSLQLKKASGPDCINNRLLKELCVPLLQPLCELF